ncbi:dTDP-4-dehydrorhamnose reductase [Shewanella litorisediminis]|uniref:dTDP-4-dehydrorhamnose reductase n=1 Tax=Shewanella litorisediminis TaxID=1173586 RepID=A0ABX7FZS4_9GAMM|nr:dTDP-4-dehydrorhamnose reductase [Shewanella litorisediminis]MCL2919621.1 dTDP-4-dehydrorhamnose reductase [Shewanella litorisediminis]QRH00513.1 dTDP-4-dehydrorhamnose reductase [Shewanella litorisediminis]
MNVLLLGASGQVGRALLASKPPGWRILAPAKTEVDFLQPQSVADYLLQYSPQLVINCAAYTAVDKAETDTEQCVRINSGACEQLAKAATAADAVLIHLSTDYVFDGLLDRPYREEDSPAPTSVYGQSKWLGEQSIAANCAKHLIVRTSWIFDADSNNFVNTMLRLAASKSELRVVADQVGGPTPASSLARVIWHLARQSVERNGPWGVYHFSGQPFVSWYEFATSILTDAYRLGVIHRVPTITPISATEFGSPAFRPSNSRLNGSKIQALYGVAAADWQCELGKILESKARAVNSATDSDC